MLILKSVKAKWLGLIVAIFLLLILFCSSILLGLTKIDVDTVWAAYFQYEGTNEQVIVKTSRVPRALIALVVGASLAIAGVLMQTLTRNPLASPGILGVNAGAGFFIVAGVSFFSITSSMGYTIMSFIGAAVTALVVHFLSTASGSAKMHLTPVRLTLAGAALSAMFASFTQGLLVINERAMDEVLFWLVGSVEGRKLEALVTVLPFFIVAWCSLFFVSKPLNMLRLGEEVAQGMGQRVLLTKAFATLIVILLAGGSVAIAGPILFVGLVVPHLARAVVGHQHGWLLVYSAIIGGALLLSADIAARYIIMPKEVPVGVMTAIIGTPFFIYIARRRKFV